MASIRISMRIAAGTTEAKPAGLVEVDGLFGIRRVGEPGIWLVLPWSKAAGVHEVVRRFLAADPTYRSMSDANKLAYYVGYQEALELASKDRLNTDFRLDWYRQLYESVTRCVIQFTDKVG